MLSSASNSGLPVGNCKTIADFAGCAIAHEPRLLLFNAVAFLCKNFGTTTSVFTPHIQLGAGGTYSDASGQREPRPSRSELSFHPQSAFGLKFLT